MTSQILTDWDAAKADVFGQQPIVAQHTLHQRPMFSDEGLADLLDRYPREAFGLFTMDNRPEAGADTFRHGSPGEHSGAEILEAVKRGRLWINLRNANAHLPEYAELCDDMFGELDAKTPGLKTSKRDVGVLISSPNARVFYHLDIPLVTLWQIQGEKTMYVYPTGAEFASDEQVEGVLLGETEEEIDYDPSFDARAQKIVLTPGLMATWPQTAPHRIDNSDCMNVSLSCEFMTLSATIHANALWYNAQARRKRGANPSIERNGAATKFSKAAMAQVQKRFTKAASGADKPEPTFVLDPNAENAVRDLAAS